MKFTIKTTGDWYSRTDAEKLEHLGFKFRDDPYDATRPCYKITDLTDAPTIEFETLKELVAFSTRWGAIVLTGNEIEIYDNYRE